jgi:PAS domain S-box-containing protein
VTVANDHVDRYRDGMGADVCYLMDHDGMTVASSNRNSPTSFVGKNYSFRPYFKEAMSGRPAIYLAKGVTSRERGIYVAYPVFGQSGKEGTPVVGVAVAKGSLDGLGPYLRAYKYVYLSSPEGVIFVASDPRWVFRSTRDLTPLEKDALRSSRQFGDGPWDNIGFEKIDHAAGLVTFRGKVFRFADAAVEGLPDWKIVLIDDANNVAVTRLMLILIFLSFFLLISVVTLFIFRIFLDAVHIAESEALYETLVNSSPDSIEVYSKEGRCVSINKSGLEMMRWQAEDAVGKFFDELWGPEYKERVKNAVRGVLKGKVQTFEAKMLRRDGVSVIKSVTLAPIFELSGAIRFFGCIARDVTDERRARERLVHSSKMATVGSLATGVSHEFNNVLEIILGNAELAYVSGNQETMKKTLKVIMDSTRRAAWIVKTMLDFSGKSTETRDFVDMAELIKQNLVFLGKVFEAQNITVETDLKDVPQVHCNAGQLSQAFVNIMMNSRDAMRGFPDKKLTITLDYDVDKSEIIVCFKDTGVGIREDIKSKIFGPFVTTKGILGGGEDMQPGVGLGLFVAYGIIKQHNGNIVVESEVGKGARFYVTLPIFNEGGKGEPSSVE